MRRPSGRGGRRQRSKSSQEPDEEREEHGHGRSPVDEDGGAHYTYRPRHQRNRRNVRHTKIGGRVGFDEPDGCEPDADGTRAVKGHEFGLTLSPADRKALVAFLRTL